MIGMLLFALIGGAGWAGPAPDALAGRAEGTWTGALDAGGQTLRIVVHIAREGDALAGTMDSPDQGAEGIPIEAIEPTEEGLSFRVPSVMGSYEGTWASADAVQGQWSQGMVKLPLDLARGEVAPPARVRPQDPVPPLPYAVRDVTFASVPGVTLGGTLTLPEGPGPHPGVVLVSGSGPQDRDESVMGHRPFLVLADALTRAGVAVLRYDDRGVGASTGTFDGATSYDFAKDAEAAVRHLAGLEGIDPKRVGILGHSEGGYIAPLVAGEAPVAFAVLLGAPGVPGKVVIESQVEALNLAMGASEAMARTSRASQRRILDLVVSGASEAEVRALLEEMGLPEAQIAQQAPVLVSPWYVTFLRHDPAPSLRALDVPVLALLGELDTQAVVKENAPALQGALAGNPRATVEVLPGLNHLLQPAKTGLVDEYGAIEITMAPEALERITTWIVAATR